MKAKQSGTSLVETLVSVVLGIAFMSGTIYAINHATMLNKTAREGELLAEAALGLDAYLKAHGKTIVLNGTAPGFSNPLQPTLDQLKATDFLPRYTPARTPFDGSLQFTVRKGAKNDLLGLVCDTQTITHAGDPSPQLAGAVVKAANGAGLRTSVGSPGVLNGPAHAGIVSPISGPSVVCAWAYLANPT
jgi:hypothetical protein